MSDWRDRRKAYLERGNKLAQLAAEQAPKIATPTMARAKPRKSIYRHERMKRASEATEMRIEMQGKDWELKAFIAACRDRLDRERYNV